MVGDFQGHSKFIENLDDSPNVNSKQLRTSKNGLVKILQNFEQLIIFLMESLQTAVRY